MKRKTISLLCVTAYLFAVEGQDVIKVNTAVEFLRAIAPNRTVELAPGIYDITSAHSVRTKYVSWVQNYEVPELLIKNVKNFAIEGKGAELVVSSPYIRVFSFKNCFRITIRDIVMGHKTKEMCMAGVLSLENTFDSIIESCEFYGSGAVGIEIGDSSGITVVRSTIRDCTYGAIWIRGSKSIYFSEINVVDNKGTYLIGVDESNNINFHDSNFSGNVGISFFTYGFSGDNSEDINFKRCRIADNSFEKLSVNEECPNFIEIQYGGNSFDAELEKETGRDNPQN